MAEQKPNSAKRWSWKTVTMIILILAAVVLLVPILRLAVYNHPCSDDFNYSTYAYHEWTRTHSVIALLGAAARTAQIFWESWQGTYSAAFIMSLQPGIFGFGYYTLGTFLLVGSVVLANLVFCWYFLRHKGGASRLAFLYIGALLTTAMLQWIPNAVEGMYWYNGASYYVYFHSFQMLFFCLMVVLWKDRTPWKYALLVLLGLITSVVIAGGNYVTILGSLMLLFCAILLGIFFRRKKAAAVYAGMLVVMLVGFYINATCPGTEARASSIGMETGLKAAVIAIRNSIRAGCDFTVEWTTLPIVGCAVLSALVLYPLAGRVGEKTGFRFPFPPLVTVLSVAWISAMFCPPMYAEGDAGAGRLINIVYFDYVLLLFLNVFYYSGWLYPRIHGKQKALSLVYRVAAVLSAVAICVSLYSAVSSRAVRILASGEAQAYAQECRERYDLYMQSAGQDVRVEPYQAKPEMPYLDDITEDPEDWRNQSLAKYYDLASVALIGQE